MDLDALYTQHGAATVPETPCPSSWGDAIRKTRQAQRRARRDGRSYRLALPWLRPVTDEMGVDPLEAWQLLTDAESEALLRGEIDSRELRAFCYCLASAKLRIQGDKPPSYTQHVTCAHCGPVWLWVGLPLTVASCPWCYNREHGLPIPRPIYAACHECSRFTPDTLNPREGLGQCSLAYRDTPHRAALPWPHSVGCRYWIQKKVQQKMRR